jgi:uncharacterized protein
MRSLIAASILTPLALAASPLPDYPFVYVYGVATHEVAPDKATLSFRVKSYDSEAERAYKQQSEVADAVVSFAEKLGVADSDIVAQAIEKSVVRREDDKGKEFEIVGYEAVRAVTIQFRELARFPELIEFLYRQPNVEGVSVVFGSKDESAILQKLTDKASRAARDNAEQLSKSFDRKLGAVRAISENGFAGLGSAFGFPGESYYGAGAGSAASKRDFRVIPATVSFRKVVYAIFAIN